MHLRIWCLILTTLAVPAVDASDGSGRPVRVATFNIFELTAQKLAAVDAQGQGNHPQLLKAAEVLQRVRPDIVLINEIDYEAPSETAADTNRPPAARMFLDRYLKVAQHGQPSIDYPHMYYQAVNTGVPTGLDIDNDGRADGPADAYGFGRYPGQYGMLLLSRFPIVVDQARTFRLLRWVQMPGALIPDGKSGKPDFLSPAEVGCFRLSSKSHWDVPVRVGDHEIHLLCSHPTPPVFDKSEDLNGRRNFDEIRLWADYIAGGERAAYLRDDQGRAGGLTPGANFIVLGDLNSDPVRSESTYGKVPIQQLLDLPQLSDPRPRQGGLHQTQIESRPANPDLFKTSHFGRLDYVLPSRTLKVTASGVFHPAPTDVLHRLVNQPHPASDHDLVWVDLEL